MGRLTDQLPHARIRDAHAVFFDLDGTLLDAYQSHYRVYGHVFRTLRRPFDEAAYARHYSPNWYLFYERLGVPRELWPEADRLWLHFYEQEAPASQYGADDLLSAVAASGRVLGLVTAGDRGRVLRDLQRMGWETRFQVVVCGGDVPERKPHPAPLTRALALTRMSPEVSVYVGDTVDDVVMGKAAGVLTAGVLGGFTSPEAFAESAPDVLVESLTDLVAILSGHEYPDPGAV